MRLAATESALESCGLILHSRFVALCAAAQSGFEGDAGKKAHAQLLRELALFEFQVRKLSTCSRRLSRHHAAVAGHHRVRCQRARAGQLCAAAGAARAGDGGGVCPAFTASASDFETRRCATSRR